MQRLFVGLDTSNDDIPISFLINTVLNPFLVSFEMVQMIASSLRDAALLTIGEIQVLVFFSSPTSQSMYPT